MPTAPPAAVRRVLESALEEDLAGAGDITTDALIGDDATGVARIVAREPGRIAGLTASLRAFTTLDDRVTTDPEVEDGADVPAGATLAIVSGPLRALLTAERSCLNLLGHLSGIATATAQAAALVAGTGAVVADTRKTTPGLRALEKYAVRVGGGANHRFGLYDAVLIKDNHIAVVGSVAAAVAAARAAVGHTVTVEVEVEDLDQLAEALDAGADTVLLDNMGLDDMRAAVAMARGRATTEASGGVTPDRLRAVAATGVDIVSMGWITHSAPRLDVAMDID